MNLVARPVAIAATLMLLVGPATAQSVKLLGEFRSWSAYAATESTGPVCFAMSKPTQVEPTPDGFADAYLYLTHRPSEGVRNEMNVVAGFTFAPDTVATAMVSGQSFELLTSKDAAWLKDPAQND